MNEQIRRLLAEWRKEVEDLQQINKVVGYTQTHNEELEWEHISGKIESLENCINQLTKLE